MLTDEQREALEWCIGALEDPESKTTQAILDTVRGLLSSAAPAEGREAVRPEPGTTEYGSWINNAQKEANIRFSWIDQKFKWLCAFEQALRIDRASTEGTRHD